MTSWLIDTSALARLAQSSEAAPWRERPRWQVRHATRSLLATLVWHPVDAEVAEEAGSLGRRWLPSPHTIDGADLAIAATVIRTGSHLLTRNVRHFSMFPGLQAPY